MGRFYKTARPEFVDDFIYQPPWEMMAKSAERKQIQFDNALAQTNALNDLLKIRHIDEEVENTNVAAEKDLFETQIEDITNQIRETGEYRRLMPRIRQVQKDIMQSREDGNIAKFEQSAAIRDKYLEAISKAKKDGGDIAGANAAYRTYMNRWLSQGERSLDDTLQFEEVIGKPDELNAKSIVELAKKVPAYQNSTFTIDPKGGYIVTTNGKQEYVSKDQLLESVQPFIMSNPNLRPYLDQRQRFGLGEYFNPDGSLIAPYEVTYYDANGSVYSAEEAKELPEDQQNNLRKRFDFANNSLGQAFRLGTSFEFNKDKSTSRLQVDQARENALNRNEKAKDRALRAGLQEDKQAHDKDMLALRHKNKLELEALDGNEDALNQLNRENGFNSFGEIKNKPITDLFSISQNGAFNEAGKDKLHNIFKDLSKGLTEQEQGHYAELEQEMLSGNITTSQQANAFLFKKKYPTVNDYIKDAIGVSQNTIDNALAGAEYTGNLHGEIIAAKAHYENYLTKGEDWYVLGIANETNSPVFKTFDNFSERTKKYLDDHYNEATVVKEFELLPLANGKAVTEIVNNNKDAYTFLDASTGEVVVEPGNMKQSKGVSGASGRAVSQSMFLGEDGNRYIAVPLNSNSPSELAIRNIAIQGLPQNSRTKNELQDFRRGSVMQQFQEAGKTNDFNQEITIEDNFFNTNSKLKQVGNGVSASYQVIDNQFGTVQEFTDEDTFFNYLEEKAKLRR